MNLKPLEQYSESELLLAAIKVWLDRTPLEDRCYNLQQKAIQSGLYGALARFAGTLAEGPAMVTVGESLLAYDQADQDTAKLVEGAIAHVELQKTVDRSKT